MTATVQTYVTISYDGQEMKIPLREFRSIVKQIELSLRNPSYERAEEILLAPKFRDPVFDPFNLPNVT